MKNTNQTIKSTHSSASLVGRRKPAQREVANHNAALDLAYLRFLSVVLDQPIAKMLGTMAR